jgi:hypothetical protein
MSAKTLDSVRFYFRHPFGLASRKASAKKIDLEAIHGVV